MSAGPTSIRRCLIGLRSAHRARLGGLGPLPGLPESSLLVNSGGIKRLLDTLDDPYVCFSLSLAAPSDVESNACGSESSGTSGRGLPLLTVPNSSHRVVKSNPVPHSSLTFGAVSLRGGPARSAFRGLTSGWTEGGGRTLTRWGTDTRGKTTDPDTKPTGRVKRGHAAGARGPTPTDVLFPAAVPHLQDATEERAVRC